MGHPWRLAAVATRASRSTFPPVARRHRHSPDSSIPSSQVRSLPGPFTDESGFGLADSPREQPERDRSRMARATSTSTVAASSTRPPPRLRDDRADHAGRCGEPGRRRDRLSHGMAATPDNSTLIIAESFGGQLTAYDGVTDGRLSNRACGRGIQRRDLPPHRKRGLESGAG